MSAKKPKYLSRFTFGNVVTLKSHGGIQGTVVAVKFTESSVFYDVKSGDVLFENVPSLQVIRDDQDFDIQPEGDAA